MSDENGKSLRIVVVDDQELVRLGLTVTLNKQSGMAVVGEAGDGVSAVQICQQLVPDIVLMDLAMPRMNGIEATQKIKSANPHVRVIMLTTHEGDEDVFAALGAGADAYCLKSIKTKQLAGVLETVATGAAWLDPAIASKVLGLMKTSQQKTGGSSSTVEPALVELSARELEVLALVVEGLTNPQMAERLVVSPETIKSHMRHIMEKLAVSDRTQAAVKALKMGLISPP
ncbi:MAG TPA: response regulator transcription factor [Planktothrix sp.]|jgi:DNA-binding NarL/FixJ family response regulator